MSVTDEELVNRYTYHAPTEEQKQRHEEIRQAVLSCARTIVRLTPYSREQSTALTNLDNVMLLASAAIARNEPSGQNP